jgi:hypothetical protein
LSRLATERDCVGMAISEFWPWHHDEDEKSETRD